MKPEISLLDAFETWCYRQMLKLKWTDEVRKHRRSNKTMENTNKKKTLDGGERITKYWFNLLSDGRARIVGEGNDNNIQIR